MDHTGTLSVRLSHSRSHDVQAGWLAGTSAKPPIVSRADGCCLTKGSRLLPVGVPATVVVAARPCLRLDVLWLVNEGVSLTMSGPTNEIMTGCARLQALHGIRTIVHPEATLIRLRAIA